ncbi:alpha-1,2-mannosyltransferase ALG9 [Cylas formicarius]|uniref:alpha-1,2-mannosyltransferase ALG9 n=1 Tax=Cylas formicarius TaxID=197179 RepID=UPI0029588D6E|nr:alpha-1,2-mannosyltransferase ALG9 [Cylas formicarius]
MVKQHSFRLRKNTSNSMRKDTHKKNKALNIKSERKIVDSNLSGLVFPAGETAFKILLSARFCAAIWSHITDCDETFNYWEPTHFMVFGKGLQTWEYSPRFAIRSYLYIMVHSTPLWIYNKILQPNPLLMFYFLRCLLGLICAVTEVYFYKSVCKEFGVHIGRICLVFQLFSPGMFISSTAFLPSSFAMYSFTAACAAWWQQRYALAIFFVALGALLGWPFAAVLGVPIAFDMVVRRRAYFDFIIWSAVSAIAILGPMIVIDSVIYGKLVIAPLNIVQYNVFGGSGPELYGTEPFSFYLLNGLLNFNLIWILSVFCPAALILNYLLVPSRTRSTLYLPHWLSLSPMFLWLIVFMFQKHKEERFLFPIYTMICLSGAVSLDIIQKLWFRGWAFVRKNTGGSHYLDKTTFVMVITIIVTSILGISRIFALYRNYHAPLDLMIDLNRYPLENNIPEDFEIQICLGKDWHRYPSSFFLPNHNWNINFVKSEFNGMLPAPYSTEDNATKLVHKYFNDENKEELTLYIDVDKCHFMLDLDLGRETDLEPIYAKRHQIWTVISSYPFLNAEKSNKLARSFFVPFISEKYVVFGNFSLLQAVKLKFT